ncbi:hypothetical protein HK099_005902 [Clydaea vesicula]|uniref:Uncharacterized protein n=1 Tax=Clydaea vesicula TaxID=447962 RepID=A0AAD5TYJ5_9FUNG|nr:hypothetical protein HK099_005902 [Clydaea vesicula]
MDGFLYIDKSDEMLVEACLNAVKGLSETEQQANTPTKVKFVEELFQTLVFENDILTLIVLCLIRGCDVVFCENGIQQLLSHSKLNKNSTFNDDEPSLEALKILTNCIYLDQDLKYYIVDNGSVKFIIQALEKTQNLLSQYLLIRALFLLTIQNNDLCELVLKEFALDKILLKIFENFVNSPNLGKVETETLILNDLLKTFYNFTHKMSSYGFDGDSTSDAVKNEEQRTADMDRYKEWIPLITKVLTNHPQKPNQILPTPHSFAINALMNFPLINKEWKRKYWFPNDNFEFIEVLLKIFETTILKSFPTYEDIEEVSYVSPGISVDDAITPLMILLCNICKWDSRAKKIVKAKIMPPNIDRSKPLDKQNTLPSRLIAFMTSSSQANLKTTGSELMFICCDENTQNLISYTGYGHAAGFLFERGFNPNQPAQPEVQTGGGPEIEEIPEELENSVNINPITGVFEKMEVKDDKLEEMTEEEKEVEAEKLMVLLDRLNKNGIIKTVMKNE